MKNKILITGTPGIGKTTLVKKIVNHLQTENVNCSGFYTEEVREGSTRIGFDIVTLSGDREVLARKSHGPEVGRPKVGPYEVHIKEFEKLALPIFQKVNYTSNFPYF